MAYIGKRPLQGNYKKLSDISGSFNGSTTAFTLQSAGVNVSPQSEENCIINISGVQQEPGSAFTISSSTITFTEAQLSAQQSAANTEEANNNVRATRKAAYGDIGDQLDEIYKDIDAWKARIKSIKDANPKQ